MRGLPRVARHASRTRRCQDPYLWYGIGLLYERHYSLEQARARAGAPRNCRLTARKRALARTVSDGTGVAAAQAEEAFMAVLQAAPAFEHAAEARTATRAGTRARREGTSGVSRLSCGR